MQLTDPGLASLRRAGRVTLVAPIVFWFYLDVVDLPIAAMFGAFGAVAILGMADFGGEPVPRARAYLVLTLLGAGLVLLGSTLNPFPVAAALVAIVVTGAARFAGCFGGYFQAAVSPLVLAFVLGATVSSPGVGLGGRVLGWVTAGVLAAAAGWLLWPARERRVLRALVADAADALAGGLRDVTAAGRVRDESAARIQARLDALEAALAEPRRPAGPTAHDVALAYVADQVRRIGTLLLATAIDPVPDGAPVAGLSAAAAAALDAVARALRAEVDPGDLAPVVRACLDRRMEAVDAAARRVRAGEEPVAVLASVDGAFVVRLVTFLSASLAANVATVLGHPIPDELHRALEVPAGAGFESALRRLRVLVATHLVPTSTWAQESARAGLAVGAAVLVALLLDLDHGFWVVLGTLSVLRSNAFSTGRTALSAAAGTALGFAVSTAILAVVGFDRVGLWILLIASIFLAMYTPQVVGFVVGQACFTVLVVALFNIIDPEGWRTGLVRLEDIVIGVTVSAVVGFLFWPRRAVHELRATTVALYESLVGELGRAFRGDPDAGAVRRAERRAHAAYEVYVSEQLRHPPGEHPWATLLATASQARGAVVGLGRRSGLRDLAAEGDPVGQALGSEADDVGRAFARIAAIVGHPTHPMGGTVAAATPRDIAERTRGPVRDCLAAHAHDDELGRALDVAFARDWLVELATLVEPAERAAAQARR